MADEIPFTDPLESEAFPGLLFGLTSSRDTVTLHSFDLTKNRALALLALDRRGYLIRHPIPGDFAALPPGSDGTIPLAPAPRDRDAPERRPSPPLYEIHRSTLTSWRLRENGEGGLSIQANPSNRGEGSNWITVANIDNYGQLIPCGLLSRQARSLRETGLVLSESDLFLAGGIYNTLPSTIEAARNAAIAHPTPTRMEINENQDGGEGDIDSLEDEDQPDDDETEDDDQDDDDETIHPIHITAGDPGDGIALPSTAHTLGVLGVSGNRILNDAQYRAAMRQTSVWSRYPNVLNGYAGTIINNETIAEATPTAADTQEPGDQ